MCRVLQRNTVRSGCQAVRKDGEHSPCELCCEILRKPLGRFLVREVRHTRTQEAQSPHKTTYAIELVQAIKQSRLEGECLPACFVYMYSPLYLGYTVFYTRIKHSLQMLPL